MVFSNYQRYVYQAPLAVGFVGESDSDGRGLEICPNEGVSGSHCGSKSEPVPRYP